MLTKRLQRSDIREGCRPDRGVTAVTSVSTTAPANIAICWVQRLLFGRDVSHSLQRAYVAFGQLGPRRVQWPSRRILSRMHLHLRAVAMDLWLTACMQFFLEVGELRAERLLLIFHQEVPLRPHAHFVLRT